MSFTDLPSGAKVVPNPPPPGLKSGALQVAQGVQQARPEQDFMTKVIRTILEFGKQTAEGVGSMATLPGDVYAGRTDPNSPEGMDRAIGLGLTTALAGGGARSARPEPPAPDPGVLRQGQAAVETALRPQGPWGPQGEPSAPAPSPVPRTGGPTVNTLNAADDAAQQGAYDASLEKAVGTAANRSVAGYNLNANKNNPAAIASRAGQSAVEQALSNLDQPPPAPYQGGQGGIPTGPGPKPATQVSAQELRAFLEQHGIPEDQIQQSLAAHSEFVGTNAVQKPSAPEDVRTNALQKPGPKSPAPLQAKATPPAPKPAAKAKPTPSGPPAQRPAVSFEQREVDIPTRATDPEGHARSWLLKAAGVLRTFHNLDALLRPTPTKLARAAIKFVTKNYPEVEGQNPQTLNKIADDIRRRLSSGK